MDLLHLIIEIIIIIVSGVTSAIAWKWKQHQFKREEREKAIQAEAERERAEKEKQQAQILRNLEALNAGFQQMEVSYRKMADNDKRQDEAIAEIKAEIKAGRKDDLATQRYILLQAFNHYRRQGYADANDRQTMAALIESYEYKGGDGFIHNEYEIFKNYPYSPIKKAHINKP